MYVLRHSRKWWYETCEIKCPDCDSELKAVHEGHYLMDIIDQKCTFWKRGHAKKYDVQYHATFKCNHCGCVFKTWSHIIKDAGPLVSMYDGDYERWNGFRKT